MLPHRHSAMLAGICQCSVSPHSTTMSAPHAALRSLPLRWRPAARTGAAAVRHCKQPAASQQQYCTMHASSKPLNASRVEPLHTHRCHKVSHVAHHQPQQPTRHSSSTTGIAPRSTATDSSVPPGNVRNIAIIAHVDHGKTTLVDCLLRQSNTKLAAHEQRVMDSNTLERERGITILSKCTSIIYQQKSSEVESSKHGMYQINLVDTPGHADFGGEVERIMSMVDGVCLVVDATDGPMTQTKFVLSKALQRGIRVLVVINKVDRETARIGEVENEIFDLFVNLNASDEQMEYPVVYASAKDGWATTSPDVVTNKSAERPPDMSQLFSAMTTNVPPPTVDVNAPFSMLVTQIDVDTFLGKILLGRVTTGRVRVGDRLQALHSSGKVIETIKVTKILSRRGLEQIAVDEGQAGDVISLAGFSTATVNDTLCDVSVNQPLKHIPIDPPTLSMTFTVNDSPLAGREGTKLTSSVIQERLRKEAESNVSLNIVMQSGGESFEVRGRGELQLGILIETMRREGFELSISAPQVVFKDEKDPQTGKVTLMEPLEEVLIDTPDEYSGAIIERLSQRKGELKNFEQLIGGKSKLSFIIPMRGLIGYRSELQNETKGQAIMNTLFNSYVPHLGYFDRSQKGALISMAGGKATAHALETLQSRGVLFVAPGDTVYEGMVVGEHSKEADLEINPAKTKVLSNVRATTKEESVKLTPPRTMSLEEVIAYVRDDECIEVTTKSIRLRKKALTASDREKLRKAIKVRQLNAAKM